MLLDNFEQHLESFVLNTQNAWQSSQNQTIRLNTSKNELLRIFCGFRVFEYALWQKTKTPEMPEINAKLSKSKSTKCKCFTITAKLLKSNQ